MIHWVCKTCGRSLKAKDKPNFCYFDRTTAIENIGDEDALKMGLFSFSQGIEVPPPSEMVFEFFQDIRYDPRTGERIHIVAGKGHSLIDFQNSIMRRVVA